MRWIHAHKNFLLLYALFFVVTYIPFAFPASDQSEVAPVLMHILKPSLFANDWFVQASLQNNYRMYFITIMTFLAKLLTLKYAYLIATVIVTFFSFLAVFKIALCVFRSEKTALLAVFLLMFISTEFSIYNQPVIDHALLPRAVNMMFLLWALYFYLKENKIGFFTTIALATPFHLIQTGLFLGCLLIGHVLTKKNFTFPVATGIFFTAISLLFFRTFLTGTTGLTTEQKGQILEALALIRNPNLASIKYISLAGLAFQLVLVLFFLTHIKKSYNMLEKQLLALIPGALSFLTLQYVLVDVLNSYYGSFFYSRAIVFLNFVLILFVADMLSSKIVISSIFMPILFATGLAYKSIKKWISYKSVAILAALAAIIATQAYVCITSSCLEPQTAMLAWGPIILIAAVYFFLSSKKLWPISCLLVLIFLALKFAIIPQLTIQPVLETLQKTPQDAIILAPPEFANEIWFYAQRSVVFNYDVIPSNPQSVLQWRERLLAVTNNANLKTRMLTTALKAGYDSLSKKQVLSVAKKYNATILLSRTQYNCPLLGQGAGLNVYDIATCEYE